MAKVTKKLNELRLIGVWTNIVNKENVLSAAAIIVIVMIIVVIMRRLVVLVAGAVHVRKHVGGKAVLLRHGIVACVGDKTMNLVRSVREKFHPHTHDCYEMYCELDQKVCDGYGTCHWSAGCQSSFHCNWFSLVG